ncbi:5,10-methylenetetrahydrofolate reductase [Brachybacterium vulturis]|uniref:Methylenetetrahydrofolate reductase n=1 Tax=Brachybacterium vulturis TaxID=2017484 RepID=A0A291GSQ6_9MICO|nr:methylenetetrahydrofolate reductase [Brachybacterium vulturis]ATG53180.1 5,10-methylenetetrahydrofolate reductase [Brachybacterium vulturis]
MTQSPLPGPVPHAAAQGREVQFEVIPLRGILDEVSTHLPPGARVTVTASPALGLPATLELAGALAQRGFPAIPHLAARMLHGAGEVEEVLARLTETGVTEAFVIAGDAPHPAGDLPGALELLEAIGASGSGITVGVGVHPEGHPFVSESEAMRLLRAKAEHASYAVTQMCFEAAPLLAWVRRLREGGLLLPVRPGIAVPAGTARLLRIGTRIGVGRSLRMLSGEDAGVRRLLGPGHWSPGPLLEELERARAAQPELGLHGPHLFTFNAVRVARECAAGL